MTIGMASLALLVLSTLSVPAQAADDVNETEQRGSTDSSARTGGALLWQDRLQADGFAVPDQLVVEGDRVVVVGEIADAEFNFDFLVRVYKASTGQLLWQDRFDRSSFDDARAVVVQDGLVFVAGSTLHDEASVNIDLLVRVYDLQCGRLVWQDQFDRAGNLDEVSLGGAFKSMAVEQGRLFLGGRARSAHGDSDFFVRAYDARRGRVLWQDIFDRAGLSDIAFSVAADEGRVFAGGMTNDGVIQHFTVRAYDARTGGLLWMDQHPTGASRQTLATDYATLAAQGGLVVAQGSATDASGSRVQLVARAYDAGTGTVLWDDEVDNGGGADVGYSVALEGDRAFVAGSGGAGCSFAAFTDCDWLIRAYDARTGSLLWDQQRDQSGADDTAALVAVKGDRIVASGIGNARLNADGGFEEDWLVQAYDARNGDLMWEDRLTEPNLDFAPNAGLVVKGNRVFVAGNVTSSITGGTDWLVRVYELH